MQQAEGVKRNREGLACNEAHKLGRFFKNAIWLIKSTVDRSLADAPELGTGVAMGQFAGE